MNRPNVAVGGEHRHGDAIDGGLPAGSVGIGQNEPATTVESGINRDPVETVALNRGGAVPAISRPGRPAEHDDLIRPKARGSDRRENGVITRDPVGLTDDLGAWERGWALVNPNGSRGADEPNRRGIEARRGEDVADAEQIGGADGWSAGPT